MEMFFQNWEGLWKTALVGLLAYVGLILFLRITGKRTLSKMNAFDLIVTVALGSTLATIMVSKQTPLAEGLVALAMLVHCNTRSLGWRFVPPGFVELSKANRRCCFTRGEFLQESMRKERVVRDEILAAVRQQGVSDLMELEAVVLETDGSLNVVRSDKG